MEIRGVKLKKITRRNKSGSDLYYLKPADHYSVPLLADDGDGGDSGEAGSHQELGTVWDEALD